MELDFRKTTALSPPSFRTRKTDRVLMVGFMNEEAFQKTVETGFAVFYSRSRNKLWLKGETSGHRLVVKEISTDCDHDTVLLKVEALGPGVCHEGYQSCFFAPAGRRRVEHQRSARLRSHRRLRELNHETETWNSQRQPGKRDRRSVPPRRISRSPPAAARISRRLTIPKSSAC